MFSLSLFPCFHPSALPCREKTPLFLPFQCLICFPLQCFAVCVSVWGGLGSVGSTAPRSGCRLACGVARGFVPSPALALADPDPEASQSCVLSSAGAAARACCCQSTEPTGTQGCWPDPTRARLERGLRGMGWVGLGGAEWAGSAVGSC